MLGSEVIRSCLRVFSGSRECFRVRVYRKFMRMMLVNRRLGEWIGLREWRDWLFYISDISKRA